METKLSTAWTVTFSPKETDPTLNSYLIYLIKDRYIILAYLESHIYVLK